MLAPTPPAPADHTRLQVVVFALVCAAFANIYITQPVLALVERDFAADTVQAARSVSAVLLGIALANLPFGYLADRFPVRPLVATGGIMIACAGVVAYATHDLQVLIAARFVQGLFVPALTTCLAAHLARVLPVAHLNVVMGSYVAATVLGGMLSRLLGGWIHAPAHWRNAFLSAAAAVLIATVLALRELPPAMAPATAPRTSSSFIALLSRGDLWLCYLCGAAGQSVFSPVFNYMPYRLAEAPFGLSTRATSLVYLVYLVGVFMAPAAGRVANRWGTGRTLIGGAVVLLLALSLLLVPMVSAVVVALVLLCGGFFTIHAAAVGALNRKLSSGQGRANALYVLGYYGGAALGITWGGVAYQHHGWPAVIGCAMLFATVPLGVGLVERAAEQRAIVAS